jgi:predicted transposase/invertase (TIGR01784 family)
LLVVLEFIVMRYLDPKNDLVFKKIFGGHAHILLSFLNGLLPLEDGQIITEINYLPAEMVPEVPVIKNSIVDVRCKDNGGRQFIVEMQMLWTDSFKSRILFNASKAYVRQLDKGIEYKGLQPVYALSLVNEEFEHDTDEYYHHYKIVHIGDSSKTIDGLQLIFVELPKFTPHTYEVKKLKVLWLRYMSEIKNGLEMLSQELIDAFNTVPEIAEALELAKESGYTKAELEAYDKYWDSVSTERTLIADAEAKGREEGREAGREEGREEGATNKQIEFVLNSYDNGIAVPLVAIITKLTENEVLKILEEQGRM